MSKRAPEQARTRQTIIHLLKMEGPREASALAKRLKVTPMAVRQHLYELHASKLVTFEDEPRPMGRPARVWRLTPDAEKLFPDAHGTLAVRLIDAMHQALGPSAFQQVLTARTKQQIEAYRARISARAPVRARVEALAAARSEEGYMAEARAQDDGSVQLIENHCAICAAAKACQGFCASELDVFRDVLGPDVLVERTEHILSGTRRCAYRITPKR